MIALSPRFFRPFGDQLQHVADAGAKHGAVPLDMTEGKLHRFRRTLLSWGCAGIALAHALLGVAYATGHGGIFVLTLTLSAIACYAMSLGPVTWVLISEIFPNRIRGPAVSIAVSALWTACFLLTFTFPMLSQRLETAGTFWLYSAICLAGLVFILLRVPETKGKTLEQIEHEIARTATTNTRCGSSIKSR
jgi:hypothetical protein